MPPGISPFGELFASLSGALERLGVGWYVFGAQAAIVHGAERLTADVDVTVALGDRPTAALVEHLTDVGFQLRVSDVDGFVARTRVLPFRHDATSIDLDVVLAGPGPEELFLRRAVPRQIEGRAIPFARAEDLVAMKILAGRPKDVEDVVQVLTAQGDAFDVVLTRETLATLEEALGQNDLLPELDRALARAERERRRSLR